MILLQLLFPFMQIAAGMDVKLTPDTFDLTGYPSVVIRSEVDLNGAVILSRNLYPIDTFFVFTLDKGKVKNGTMIGANGNAIASSNGYMGAIRVWTTGTIENVHTKDFDKWCFDIRGNRKTLTDTTYIRNCIFESTRRDGYAYGLWNQYGTALVENCHFKDMRHGTDGSSEAHRTILINCTFERCSQSAVHNHEYRDGYSGSGTDVIGCTFISNALDVDLEPAFPPFQNVIRDTTRWKGQSTCFWIKSLGPTVTVGGDTLPKSKEWKYYQYRSLVTIRVSGTGSAFIEDFIQPGATPTPRYFLMEDGKAPSIRYVTPGGKADRSTEDRVSGDKSLRIRVENQIVEVY